MMSRSLFRKAVCCALSEWPALQIAVENSFGGVLTKKKARWLTEVTADFLENNKGDCGWWYCKILKNIK